jgi:hypothetical protein
MSAAPRKPAPRLARPAARYWKGKVPKGVDATAADSDESEGEEVEQLEEEGDVLIQDIEGDEEEEDALEVKTSVVKGKGKANMNVALRDVNISKEGKVIVAGREEVGKTEAELGEDVCGSLRQLLTTHLSVQKRRTKKRRRMRRRMKKKRYQYFDCAYSELIVNVSM